MKIKNKINNYYIDILRISLKKYDFIGYIKYLVYIIFKSKANSKNIIKLHCKEIYKAFIK